MLNVSQVGVERKPYVHRKIYPCFGTHPLLSETAGNDSLMGKSQDNVDKKANHTNVTTS